MTRKQKRLAIICAGAVVLGLSATLVLTALRSEIVFFRTPTEIVNDPSIANGRLRIGGLVTEGSVVRGEGERVTFAVNDTEHELKVTYVGILPDLFREGQGIVAEGTVQPDGTFTADTVLAKHDETYMPREVADALKEKGVWQGQGETTGATR